MSIEQNNLYGEVVPEVPQPPKPQRVKLSDLLQARIAQLEGQLSRIENLLAAPKEAPKPDNSLAAVGAMLQAFATMQQNAINMQRAAQQDLINQLDIVERLRGEPAQDDSLSVLAAFASGLKGASPVVPVGFSDAPPAPQSPPTSSTIKPPEDA